MSAVHSMESQGQPARVAADLSYRLRADGKWPSTSGARKQSAVTDASVRSSRGNGQYQAATTRRSGNEESWWNEGCGGAGERGDRRLAPGKHLTEGDGRSEPDLRAGVSKRAGT